MAALNFKSRGKGPSALVLTIAESISCHSTADKQRLQTNADKNSAAELCLRQCLTSHAAGIKLLKHFLFGFHAARDASRDTAKGD